jgi:hypothetical protein
MGALIAAGTDHFSALKISKRRVSLSPARMQCFPLKKLPTQEATRLFP